MLRSLVGRALVGLLVASGLIVLLAPPASAHAFLVRSSPSPGARLATAPSLVTLDFSEAVMRSGTSVRLTTLGEASSVALPFQLAGGDTEVEARMTRSQNGVYEIAWQTTSADDGHVTSGTFAFAVGRVARPVAGPTSRSQPPEPIAVLADWLFFLGVALSLGGLATALTADPSLTSRAAATRLGLGIALAASTLASVQALSGIGTVGRAPPRVAQLTVVATCLIAIALAVSSWARRPWAAILLVLASVGAWAGLGHGHADLGGAGWFVETVHLAAAAIWLGALVHLVLGLRTARRKGGDVWPSAVAYARLAAFAVVALGGSGLYLAISLMRKLSNLWTTGYGQLIVVKSSLLLFALALALVGRVVGIRQRRLSVLRRSMPLEAGVLAVVLVLSSLLIGVGPPSPALPGSVAGVLGPPPLIGAVLREAGFAGELTVGIALNRTELQIEVYAAEDQPPGTKLSAELRRGANGTKELVKLATCGPGCGTAPVSLPSGVSELWISASSPHWLGGTFTTSLRWPPPPLDPALLASVISAMRAVPHLSLHEVTRSGPYHTLPIRAELSGEAFIGGEPYVNGADDVRDLPHDERGLSLYVSGDRIWVKLWLDSKDRITREWVLSASDELERTFSYPKPPSSRPRP